ncbi:MAG: nucleotidyltransferase domain-containing protein [Gammaproteobacteria bacterium]|nr:nucleotidyltransferase domain-containing protein [Gammaproteobacteria bacterium]
MRAEIIARLHQLEKEEQVTILYACESGSRAWGFESKDSDYDVRFIYVRARSWYLRVDSDLTRDVLERPINDLLDISGWDLKKALKLLYKSNPALLEWLSSPTVYLADKAFVAALKSRLPEYYSPRACFYHYAHMAQGNFRQYLQGSTVRIKKYFYVLRPILAMQWIERGMGRVPMEFETLVDRLVDDVELKAAIQTLLAEKRAGFEQDYLPRRAVISRFVEAELQRLNKKAADQERIVVNYDSLNSLFLELLDMP